MDHDRERQMWSCTGCEILRQWGIGDPEDIDARPWLDCEGTCGGRRPHAFACTLPLGRAA